MMDILPCKKHKIKPQWREVEFPSNTFAACYPPIKHRELYCYQCEAEKEIEKNTPGIKQWNEKQK